MAVETDIPALSLAELTAIYSRVLRERPELQGNRAVDLFIQDCIDELKARPERQGERPPLAPVDFDTD